MENTQRRVIHWKWPAAAAVLFAIAVSVIMLNMAKHKEKKTEVTNVSNLPSNKNPPSSSKATITLADGQVISLDSFDKGPLAVQGKVKIIKLADGGIDYNGSTAEPLYNTLTNPLGSKVIDIKLADGTRLWLNSGSSITYPVAFTGTQRKVSITGEAYFEVAKSRYMPFIVGVNQMEIEVLGTHFNVNGYSDEAVTKTTLLEGSIRIRTNSTLRMLKPGQQIQTNKSGECEMVNEADIDEAIAWKEGNFQFENTSIYDAMRQIGRWYNMEVEYKGTITKHFFGTISRDVDLLQVLNMLQQSAEIKFWIEGGKIIVMP
ncbi:MAG: FecR domain-containing protein [Chitinophagaceae bacterium]|nr:FecR domain-containing protein [Chitinophagaceae bacterium]